MKNVLGIFLLAILFAACSDLTGPGTPAASSTAGAEEGFVASAATLLWSAKASRSTAMDIQWWASCRQASRSPRFG